MNEQTEKFTHRIRSFVKREGRLTKGQAAALERQWPGKGLQHQADGIDFDKAFGRPAPLVLEIGFGMGHSLVEMAKADPDSNYIGIEVHGPGVGACLMEAEAQGVENLRIFQHDAVEILQDCVADESLAKIQVFFPDPWHKKRHHKRRLIRPEFVQLMHAKLQHGGILHLATDWENYAEHMLEVMQGEQGWDNLSANGDYVPRPDSRPLTKFEQRGQRLGHGVWDLQFKKS
ncbi:tRNA (guanosine(46)-N7)-methyltransferase TrmB [Aliidiomarina sedimenti]|uniref:tRNA (guanine-N(7)-)-methyltransferase n=1 Tax=Aliidiomarina sedimenti TaxID=1933879 RepID=A0ABY0BX84_9GAMM|nr:tRNA (guanosine(46)-N7)-methyltransferase TrmB [Aliidiomarina sedimenti]RUO28990.1 tRNA (guanosine(46)-N7)-methyltransferase TrmB [Aliidiomarina sedimenti]